jgi:transposase-like protein
VTIEQIATDFGVHPMTMTKWMRQADIGQPHYRRRTRRGLPGQRIV